MRRSPVVLLSLFALAACAPPVPESGPGGQSYSEFLRARDAGSTALPISPERVGPAAAPAAGVAAAPTTAPVAGAATPPARLSDEQNFDAVASRESIESDAERRRAQQEALVVVPPTAVPTRTGEVPNVIQYALNTTHNPGTKLHSRFPFSITPLATLCGRYASDDLAQEAFLAAGGPARDSIGLDPDGDGFACRWDPRPYRAAMK